MRTAYTSTQTSRRTSNTGRQGAVSPPIKRTSACAIRFAPGGQDGTRTRMCSSAVPQKRPPQPSQIQRDHRIGAARSGAAAAGRRDSRLARGFYGQHGERPAQSARQPLDGDARRHTAERIARRAGDARQQPARPRTGRRRRAAAAISHKHSSDQESKRFFIAGRHRPPSSSYAPPAGNDKASPVYAGSSDFAPLVRAAISN